MPTAYTADLMDGHPHLDVVDPIFRDYGGRLTFFGPIETVKLHEDNSLVREILEEPGQGRVLVVDGGGSVRCAVVGDQLAALAHKNDWSGIVVYGAVRDARLLKTLDVGIKALNTSPRKSIKRGQGQRAETLRFAGALFVPGQFLYADEDGIVLSESELVARVHTP